MPQMTETQLLIRDEKNLIKDTLNTVSHEYHSWTVQYRNNGVSPYYTVNVKRRINPTEGRTTRNYTPLTTEQQTFIEGLMTPLHLHIPIKIIGGK